MKLPQPSRTLVRTKWTTLVAVCRECSGGKRLSKVLKRSLKDANIRDIRVLSTSCLDVCPKRGVTVATTCAGGVKTAVLDDKLEGVAAVAAVLP
jgi:predicted metal-binding protein